MLPNSANFYTPSIKTKLNFEFSGNLPFLMRVCLGKPEFVVKIPSLQTPLQFKNA